MVWRHYGSLSSKLILGNVFPTFRRKHIRFKNDRQQSRRRYAANGFAFVPIRTVFLDGIVRAVETGSYATHRSDEERISAALTCSRGPHPLLVLYTNVGRFDINA